MREDGAKTRIPIYLVDAFTDEQFRGNPAAVCLLQDEYDDTILQSIAEEMNLSETAFVSSIDGKPLLESSKFSLRWFTPKVEVPLCGHGTLATAAVLFSEVGVLFDELTFETKSGQLMAAKDERGIRLDFPSNDPEPIEPPHELINALGITDFEDVVLARVAKKVLIRAKSPDSVKDLKPDFERMMAVNIKEDIMGVIVSSPGEPPFDFISRFFAPWVGINEDPVTGAAHTVLTPYWSKILGKTEMSAYQASKRGGTLIVRLESNNRVNLIGNAVIVLKGELYL